MKTNVLLVSLFAALLGACVGDVGPNSDEQPYDDEVSEDAELGSSSSALANGFYVFGSGVSSSRCMDIEGADSKDGTNIHQWTCNYSVAQKFSVEPFGNGVRLINKDSGDRGSKKCVDVAGGKLEEFTNVQLYTCNGTPAQTFRLVDKPGGVQIIHIASGRCVGVAGASPNQRANIRISNCTNGPTHIWFPRGASGDVRIMPLGASITEGSGGTHAGYRGPLSQLLNQANIQHTFVGSSTANPGPLPGDKRHHEGHPGWVISEVRANIDNWLGVNPDVVLILLGSNDVVRGNVAGGGARLDDLLGRIRTLKPRTLIYVASVPRIDGKDGDTINYNNQVAAVVRAREARGEAVHFVDVYPPLNVPGRKSDGIHPNDAGYDVIAGLWRNAIVGQ